MDWRVPGLVESLDTLEGAGGGTEGLEAGGSSD